MSQKKTSVFLITIFLMLFFSTQVFAAPKDHINSFKDEDGSISFATSEFWRGGGDYTWVTIIKNISKDGGIEYWLETYTMKIGISSRATLDKTPIVSIADEDIFISRIENWTAQQDRVLGGNKRFYVSGNEFGAWGSLMPVFLYNIPNVAMDKIVNAPDTTEIAMIFSVHTSDYIYEKYQLRIKEDFRAALKLMASLTPDNYEEYKTKPRKEYKDRKSIPFL